MTRLILVHGAWSTAATWGKLPDILRHAGWDICVPDLPGHDLSGNDGPAMALDQITLETYRDHILKLIGDQPAVLIGHSMGGMVISAVAQAAPERVARLIYLCAFLPGDGDSLLSLIKQQAMTIGHAVRPGPDPGSTVLDHDIAAPYLCQDASPSQTGDLMAQLVPQPNAPQTDPLHVSPQGLGQVAKHYVLCTQDKTLTPKLQRHMAGDTPHSEIDTGHFPQISAPDLLARLLLRLLADRGTAAEL